MFRKIKKTIFLLKNFKLLRILLNFPFDGYLHETGWIKSWQQKVSIDANNCPIPWVTYAFIDFITPRLHKQIKLFEFGSGNSTLFYAKYVAQVFSIEHDKNWFEIVKKNKAPNVTLVHIPLSYDGDYCRAVHNCKTLFDIIIVDGRDRVNCIQQSIHFLSSTGVLILDNSERKEYAMGISFLLDNGFKRLDFGGIAPGNFTYQNTTIFYKNNNCLAI